MRAAFVRTPSREGRGREKVADGIKNLPSLPKVVLFDMDDTIFDHALTCRDALARLRQETPVLRGRSSTELWVEYGRLLERVQPDIASGVLTIDQARTERFVRLAAFCGGSASDAEAQEWSRTYRAYYQSLRRLVPGARRLLEQLHGRTVLGVVTNNQVAEQEEKVAHFGLDGLIDILVVSEGVGVSKPDPRIFSLALDRAGAEPGEAVMIGDSWENDVRGARGAGIPAVWFNRFGRRLPEPLCIPQVTSFRAPRRVVTVLSGAPKP
jgi:putative hydrolase of the HAD superfamily